VSFLNPIFSPVESPSLSARPEHRKVESMCIDLPCSRAIPAIRSSAAKTGPIRSTASSTPGRKAADGDTCCFAALKTGEACRTCAPRVPRMESITGASILNRRCRQIRANIPKRFGASKIRALPTFRNLSNTPWRTHPLRAAVPESRWRLTKDFKSFERYGVIMQPEDKDAALLPRRIGGLWALIHRPVTTLGAHMWISYSPDLRHWGSHKIILEARRGGWWDANKIGLCSPPIETAKGWLTIYHGVRQTASGSIYRLGLALFDLEKPEVCLQRGDSWMFGPEAPMSAAETSRMSCFRAGRPSARTETPSTCITARRIRRWRWPPAAYARCSPGWTRIPAIGRKAHSAARPGFRPRGAS
jgi:hypothetical protein